MVETVEVKRRIITQQELDGLILHCMLVANEVGLNGKRIVSIDAYLDAMDCFRKTHVIQFNVSEPLGRMTQAGKEVLAMIKS